jgi:hypothetical protein
MGKELADAARRRRADLAERITEKEDRQVEAEEIRDSAESVAPGDTESALLVRLSNTENEIQALREQYAQEIREIRCMTENAIREIQRSAFAPDEVKQIRALLNRLAPAPARNRETQPVGSHADVDELLDKLKLYAEAAGIDVTEALRRAIQALLGG